MAGTGTSSIASYNFTLDTTVQATGDYDSNEHDFINDFDGAFNVGLNFQSHSIMLLNFSTTNDLFFSFDGVNDHGRVPADRQVTQDFRRVKKIWFRGTVGEPFQFWAW